MFKPRWSEKNCDEGADDKTAKQKRFSGDADQCYRVRKWGRMKKKLNKDDMPGDGPNGESITYADLREGQPVFVVDKSGDGWSVARFLPEGTITHIYDDGSTDVDRRTPSVVFIQAMIPTSFWEPNPDWANGREPKNGLSATDVARQAIGAWSRDPEHVWEPNIPKKAVKRWRDPYDTLHTDLAPQYMPFQKGDRVVYGRPGLLGTIEAPAHPLLSSWKILPEHETNATITVPTTEFEKLCDAPTWRRSARAIDEIQEESGEEDVTPISY